MHGMAARCGAHQVLNNPPVFNAAVAKCTVKYTIKPGDGLDAIATKFKTTRAAIMSANPSITDPDKIQAGQVINIPNQPCTAPQRKPASWSTQCS
jgi:LysM repeat protein